MSIVEEVSNLFRSWIDNEDFEEVCGEWEEIFRTEGDIRVTGMNGNSAKLFDTEIVIEENSNSGRKRGYYLEPVGTKTFFTKEELEDAIERFEINEE